MLARARHVPLGHVSCLDQRSCLCVGESQPSTSKGASVDTSPGVLWGLGPWWQGRDSVRDAVCSEKAGSRGTSQAALRSGQWRWGQVVCGGCCARRAAGAGHGGVWAGRLKVAKSARATANRSWGARRALAWHVVARHGGGVRAECSRARGGRVRGFGRACRARRVRF